ncbi:zinc-finger domain-containing protein [Bacillus cereus]|uniref:zinc-finger domain-containing protein n=1 Tax=Bacillus thuringiensis TaxID=1428 RepID=UPI0018CD1E69|nr:zinc-finger domain-containing protein [Bacillus thuringiensis]MEB9334460.1 zinc-finger domain-containing protein [Bacillus cereus]
MDARKTRIRILDLLDGHCQSCEYHGGKTHPYCTETCKIGQEIQQLGTSLITDEKSREYKTKVKWDKVCQDVMELKKEGLTYVQIAEILGYDKGTIRQQLKKRGLLES